MESPRLGASGPGETARVALVPQRVRRIRPEKAVYRVFAPDGGAELAVPSNDHGRASGWLRVTPQEGAVS
jgi:hypothetical protein